MVRSLAVPRSAPQLRQVVRTGAAAFPPPAPALRLRLGCERAASPSTAAVPSRNRDGRRVARAPGVRATAYDMTRRSRARVTPT